MISFLQEVNYHITYLEHVAENAEHAVEASVLVIGSLSAMRLPLNASHNLSDEDQVDDQGCS